jgi:UDP-glucose 4-epimerase
VSKKVLVTGGRGFIGSYVVRRLLAEERTVVVFDRHARIASLPDGVEVFLGDVRDATAVTEAMAHVDSWIHLAGVLGTAEAVLNPRPAAETNVLGGINLLEAASQYGLPGVNIAVGNHYMANTYAISKTAVERFCVMYRAERGLPVTVVRALNAYGPGQSIASPFGPSKVRKITPSFVCRALTGSPIEVYGDGQQVMDMIHVRDVADVLVDALLYTEQHGPINGVLEAGTGRRTTVLDIAQQVIASAGRGDIVFKPMRLGEPEHSVVVADTATLPPIADAADFIPLEIGIKETVDWYREHWLPGWQAEQVAS